MAEATTIARPYAQAIFSIAKDEKNYAAWSSALNIIAAVVNDEKVASIIGNPKVPAVKIVDLLVSICGSNLPKLGANLIKILVLSGRVKVAPQIAVLFEEFREEAERTRKVDVVSAHSLSSEQQQKLSAALRKKLNCEVELDCRVDDSVIGGAIIRAGDQVIDGSISGQLSRLTSYLV